MNSIDDLLILGLRNPMIPPRDGDFVLFANGTLSLGPLLWGDVATDYEMRDFLFRQADHWVRSQNKGTISIEWDSIRVTVSRDPDTVAAWTMPHECESCRDGIAKAVTAVRDGMVVALCALRYDQLTNKSSQA